MADARQGNISVTVASGDGLDVRRFTIHERMSSIFVASIVAVSENPDVDFDAVVGQPARFSIQTGGYDRTWTGLCNRLQQTGVEDTGVSTYELSIVPTLWLTTQRRNHRMFQQQSELDIVLALLAEWGVEPETKLGATYKKRKYRVQYGESDFAFMSRMLEDAGISYYFQQQGGATVLVLSDAPQANELRAPPIAFRERPSTADLEHVTAVRTGQQIRPGRYTLQDHDYRRPADYKLVASAVSSGGGGALQQLESYHYTPGAFLFGTDKGEDTPHADDRGKARTDEAEAQVLAQKRLDAKRGDARVCTFDTSALDLAPGVVMSMLDHPRADLGDGKRLLVVESTMRGEVGKTISHACEVRSASLAFRPELATPRPRAIGVESATVVGPAGEEIHVDEFGRVRVQFHWDREGAMDEKSSCWIHTSQAWGGAGYGGSNLPRVGQEVLVDFLGGDPDRPIITGRVYTNLQKTPYKLPDNKTQSGLKSNSTGGSGGYNELMFEDSGGQELVRMQAEKDHHTLVKNDQQHAVGRDRSRTVGRNEDVTIGKNRTKNVAQNEQHVIGQNHSVAVGVNRSTQVGSIDSTIVGDTHVVQISPPGEDGPQCGVTSVTMSDKTIDLTTGVGASISMAGDAIAMNATTIAMSATTIALSATTVTIDATTIILHATSLLGAISDAAAVVGGTGSLICGSPGSTTLFGGNTISVGGDVCTITGTSSVTVSSPALVSITGATVEVKGGPIKLNC
jgi:type VI secretion system secreted protein VgrG